jgi:hypothetical protein
MTIQEVAQLEEWFTNNEVPKGETMLFPGTTISDMDKFLETSFLSLKNDPASKANAPVIYRLKMLKLLIEANA